MKFKLNAAARLTADTETSKGGQAVADPASFRDQNEDSLKDRQKDNQKAVEDTSKSDTTATTETNLNEPTNVAPEEGAGGEGEAGGGAAEGGEEGTGDTTIVMDIPQDNDDDMSAIDARLISAAIKRLKTDTEEVDAEADPKLFNLANQPVGPMA